MKPATVTTPDFDPMAVAPIGHNQPANDNFAAIKTEIDDLFDTAKDFADGEPIQSQEMHDVIERLRDSIHEAGKRADALRIDEKKPLDDQVKAIQDRYNPLIQPKRGRVDMAKSALDALLTPWRKKVADEKAAEAARVAAVAEAARVAATEAIRASSGNLAAREEAESLLQDAKRLEKTAARTFKSATTGTGLRTVWRAELVEFEAALDWFYGERPEEFTALVQRLADEAVRSGVRKVPGFRVFDEKVAV
ncbi:hypothetical protein IB276_26105 [Ensifer sp. ENS04]|uniref:hypothetical protein n=1 Tax=Ensifer sp. ENS04 TaxID=2769281 RepID=UPI00177E13FE|nr:hypothetical protein [Ensifer sp. ENS04]MBD9542924.1 hypothetical protein [Ensifer sp. ENS04]